MVLLASERSMLAHQARWLVRGGLMLLALLYLATSICKVEAEEEGVRYRLGRYQATLPSGIHLGLPWPLDKVARVDTRTTRRMLVGFSLEAQPEARRLPVPPYCLSGDNNIINAVFAVQYRVADAYAYLQSFQQPEGFLRRAAESIILEEVARRGVDTLLTKDRSRLATILRDRLSDELERYTAGLSVLSVDTRTIEPPAIVMPAFKDVITARENRATIIYQARDEANTILPQARGEANALTEAARADKAAVVARVQGLAERFKALYPRYLTAPEVTRDRLYLEMARSTFADCKVVLLDTREGSPVKLRLIRNKQGNFGN